jgi:pimeloyl-ACP methyl ester carboxylesterase
MEAMSADVVSLLDHLGIPKAAIMGHSSGSKVGMLVALKHPERTAALVAVDGSPIGEEPRDEVQRIAGYIDAIFEVVGRGCKTTEEAMKVLEAFEEDKSVRGFLMTNLALHHDPQHFTIRPNLKVLRHYLQNESFRFPISAGSTKYKGPTLFVVGTESGFVSRDSYQQIQHGWFPKLEVSEIEAGHWVQAEKPEEFAEAVGGWLEKVV